MSAEVLRGVYPALGLFHGVMVVSVKSQADSTPYQLSRGSMFVNVTVTWSMPDPTATARSMTQ